MQLDDKKRVGVIRGGVGEQYAFSLKHGGEIISHINKHLADKYKVFDILIDKDGVWHINGMSLVPADLVHKVDVVWNMAQPEISVHLDNLAIPNVGASGFSSALEASSEILREHMKKIKVELPRSILLSVYQPDFDGPRERYSIKKAKVVFEKFGSPWIVKSFTPDANMGVHLAKTFDELVGAIEDGVKHGKSILVEEFITGKVASAHTVKNFRNEDIYAFPLVHTFGNFSQEEKEKLVTLARAMHSHLGALHYLKSDFLLDKRGKVYLLGIQLHPDIRPHSQFSEACQSVGATTQHMVEHILENMVK